MLLPLIFVALATQLPRIEAVCVVNTSELYSNASSPLLLSPNTYTLLYPGPKHDLEVRVGASVLVACPDGEIEFNNSPMMFLTCTAKDELVFEGNPVLDLELLKCRTKQWGQVIRTGKTCGQTGEELIVGSEIGLNVHFMPFITICFDTNILRTIYAKKRLLHSRVKEHVFTKKNWNSDKMFTNVSLMETDERKVRINQLLGFPENDKKLTSKDYFLELRPLVEQYECEHEFIRRVTYRFLNAFHFWRDEIGDCKLWDWKQFNYNSLGPFLEEWGRPLDIYTGVYGVDKLIHETTGEETPLNLYEVDGLQVAPVPELLWKLIHDPASNQAVVLLLDNRHKSQRTEKFVCPPVNEHIQWIKFEDCDRIYACTYTEALRAVHQLPDVPYVGLLKIEE